MGRWMKTLTSQSAVATGPHLHVASLRSQYLKHVEFRVLLRRERARSHQQQKGAGYRQAEAGRLSRAGSWQVLPSLTDLSSPDGGSSFSLL